MSAKASTVKSAKVVSRWIGIRPRVKVKTSGELSPTEAAIVTELEDGSYEEKVYKLETDQDELDFVFGIWPLNAKYRDVRAGEDTSKYPAHHVLLDDEKKAKKENRAVRKPRVPVAYEGVREGDTVALSRGGPGNPRIAYATSRRGISVKLIPPGLLKEKRGEVSTDDDALLLAKTVRNEPEIFRDVAERDRHMVRLIEATRLRAHIQGDRKACGLRILSSLLGSIYCSEEGGYPEGSIEKLYDLATASDGVFKALAEKEKEVSSQVAAACKQIPIYAVMESVKGLGPQISAPIIAAVQDISLFPTPGKLKAYCGIHVQKDGAFPRQRRGERSAWNRAARQALWNLGESLIKQKDGFWRERLTENRAMYDARHPNPILVEKRKEGTALVPTGRTFELVPGTFGVDKKTRHYTFQIDGVETVVFGTQKYGKWHLHRMSVWRTLSEFVEWLYWKWRTMEHYTARLPKVFPPEDAVEIETARAEEIAEGKESRDYGPSAEAA